MPSVAERRYMAPQPSLMPSAGEALSLFERAQLDQMVEPRREARSDVPLSFRQADYNRPLDPLDHQRQYVSPQVKKEDQSALLGRSDVVVEADGKIRMRKYSAFVQLQIQDGVKIAPVSFPLPLGATPDMAEEILQRTLFPQTHEQTRQSGQTFGEKQELRAVAKEGNDETVLALLTRFVDTAEKVMEERHPNKNHPAYKKFKRDQAIRRFNLREIAADAEAILADKDTITTAWRKENYGKRMFVMGHRVDQRTGKVMGMGPAPDYKEFEVTSLGASEEMREWLSFSEEKAQRRAEQGTSGVTGHADGGPTVDLCTGSDRCSAFFDEMEEEAILRQSITGTSGKTITVYNGEIMEEGCTRGHRRGQCRCKEVAEEASGGE